MNIKELAETVAPNTKVVLSTLTSVKMNKKDVETKTIPNPFTEVFKESKVVVLLNASYEKMVNEQRDSEGKETDFVAAGMKYGNMVGAALLENNGQFYVKCIELEKVGESTYIDSDKNPVEYDAIKPFIPVKKPSEHQGTEKEIKARNFKLESIVAYEVVE